MLLERESQLEQLGGLLSGLDTTGGKVVLIRGEAGIGKSSLVEEFVSSHAAGAHVHVGACDDLKIPQPMSPFWDMARSESSLLEPIDKGDRLGVLSAILDLLSRSLRPTVLVIEDTHWADEATLDAIKYLGRRIARTNGLLLLTYRTGEVDYDHPLRKVFGELPPQTVERIELEGLSLSAVSSILGDSLLDPGAVLAATNGNPFLVGEMATTDESSVPPSLQDSVSARVQKLSPGAVRLLRALSVIPEPVPVADARGLTGATASDLEECERRGLLRVFQIGSADDRMVLDSGYGLEEGVHVIGFRHDLIRRAVEASLTRSERLDMYRTALAKLPEETHPCLLIQCAVEVNDIDRLLDLAPRSAMYAATIGSHAQAIDDFRTLRPHLSKLQGDDLGHMLEVWAGEEFFLDNIAEAISIGRIALSKYDDDGDQRARSRVLAQLAHFYENAGQRAEAEQCAEEAVIVLGDQADGADLARALEANAYLHWMAGNFAAVPDLVNQTLEAGGTDIDERIRIRSLVHLGVVAHVTNYPDGRANLEEARERAEAAGQWYEEGRALLNDGWAALEFRDLQIGSDTLQRAVASAVRHELPMLENYATALYARALDMKGKWTEAEDLARELLDAAAISQMVALPIFGSIEARHGRDSARTSIAKAWDLASIAAEDQRLAPTAIAAAEHAWITESSEVPLAEIRQVMEVGLEKGFQWSPGAIAFWLWELGELSEPPEGIAQPYQLMMEGKALDAAAIWEAKGLPYERGLALMHGNDEARLEALEVFETLGATAVAAKLRQALRADGVAVPRGKGRDTRRHAAGLTVRQAEVLQLLEEGLTNTEIADRLFVSPRTVENHVAAVLSKLDSPTRDEAVSRARDEGLLIAAR